MIKKICSVILTVCMMISSLGVVSVSAYSDVESEKQNQAVELIAGLGIMSPDSADSFGSKTLVRRGEFALYALKLMGYEVETHATGNDGYFSDTDTSTPEGAAVEMLVNMGAIPKEGAEYNPNEEVTYSEAVRILLNLMNYGEMAASYGGYPSGYIAVASTNDLHKNIYKSTNGVLTKTETAVLLYNALFVYPMEYDNDKYTKSDETLMEQVHDIYETEGLVTGYGDTYLGADKSIGDNVVAIDGVTYSCSATSIKDYVGYYVKAYYTDVRGEGTKIVSFTLKSDKNTAIKVSAEDLYVSGDQVEYDVDGRNKSMKLASQPQVIYNGRFYPKSNTTYTNMESLFAKVHEGEITFLANDGSDKANVIIIHEQKHLLVERVDKRNGRIYVKNGSGDQNAILNNVITIDPDDVDITVYIDGKAASFDDIKENDAITLEQTLDNEEAVLYISRKTISGTISSVNNEDNTVVIDNTEYDTSAYYTDNLDPNTEGTFAVTTNGKILGIVTPGGGGLREYAYVLNTYYDDGEECAYIKVFTTDSAVVRYKCVEGVKVNGRKCNYLEASQQVKTSELITFRTNEDGEVTEINRPYDATSKLNYVNEVDFVKNWAKSSVRYVDGIMGMSFITDDTTIFLMPRFDTGKDSDYKIITKEELSNRSYSDVTIYDMNRQGRAGALVIVEDISDSVEMSDSLFFVSKVVSAVNAEGDTVRRITGFEDGVEKTLDFSEDSTSVTYEDGWMNYQGNEKFDTGYTCLQAGDALQYTIGNDGQVSAYRLVFNNYRTIHDDNGDLVWNDPANYFEDWSGTGSVTKQDFYDDLYIMYGDVQMRYMDYMVACGLNQSDRLGYESSSSPISIIDYYRPFNLLDASVYVYNVKEKTLELGDIEDVQKGDTIFARSYRMGQKNEIMVFTDKK